jgi:hypothetical protein
MDMAAKSNPAVETCIPPPHVFERTLFRPQRIISEAVDKPRPSVKKEPRPLPSERRKARGRSRVTGNLSIRSRSLAPPQHPHGSRLPAMSRGELQADVYNRSGVCKPHQKEKPRRRQRGSLAILYAIVTSSPATIPTGTLCALGAIMTTVLRKLLSEAVGDARSFDA